MEFKGTQGEWVIDIPTMKDNICTGILDNEGNSIVDVWRFEDGQIDERNANAKLIAAAPELLGAMIDLKEVIDRNPCVVFPEDTWSLIEAVEKAISKALN